MARSGLGSSNRGEVAETARSSVRARARHRVPAHGGAAGGRRAWAVGEGIIVKGNLYDIFKP